MDGKLTALRDKLEEQVRVAAETAAELQRLERKAGTVVHYSQIEAAAHQTGNRLSRQIQTRAAREVAAQAPAQASCPDCGVACRTEVAVRELTSIDGPVELSETAAFCDRCRRSFFPSAYRFGAGRP